jgi:hypothetical protein
MTNYLLPMVYLMHFKIIFDVIVMIDHKEEINIPEHYLFSIRPSQPNLHRPNVTCDFSPIECRKTYKLIRTIPTYHP